MSKKNDRPFYQIIAADGITFALSFSEVPTRETFEYVIAFCEFQMKHAKEQS